MEREEAIKTLMGYSHTPEERAALEVLVPELAESEDERIRKKIIENVRLSGGYTDEEIDEMISWLERQKEQKPAEWKPNEEQLEAFKKYIEEFQARAEAAVGGWNNFDVMIRLYEQLKRLM